MSKKAVLCSDGEFQIIENYLEEEDQRIKKLAASITHPPPDKPAPPPPPKKQAVRIYLDDTIFKTIVVAIPCTAEHARQMVERKTAIFDLPLLPPSVASLLPSSNTAIGGLIEILNGRPTRFLTSDIEITTLISSWKGNANNQLRYIGPNQSEESNLKRTKSMKLRIRQNSTLFPMQARIPGMRNYDVLSELGTGGFGKVWRIRDKATRRIYALKVTDKENVVKEDMVAHTNLEREIMDVVGQKHPFVVRLYESFQSKERLYLVMECLEGGCLFDYLSAADRPFSEELVQFYASQIILAVECLHEHNYVYRDMKLENIMLDSDGYVRLTDFGLSHKVASRNGRVKSYSGTTLYLAPEMLVDKGHGRNVDWWAFGVLLYIMLTQEPPFWSTSRAELFKQIKKKPLNLVDFDFISPVAKSLLEELLCKDENERLGNIKDIKQHPFFDGVQWPLLLKRQIEPPLKPRVGILPDHIVEDDFEASFNELTPTTTSYSTDLFKGFAVAEGE